MGDLFFKLTNEKQVWIKNQENKFWEERKGKGENLRKFEVESWSKKSKEPSMFDNNTKEPKSRREPFTRAKSILYNNLLSNKSNPKIPNRVL